MDKQYYSDYYVFEREHWWFKARISILESIVIKILSGKKNVEILNVGIATGATTEMLSKYGKVTSLEYDKDCCDFVRNNLNIDVIEGSVTNLPFANRTFDLVCAFDVIEHVKDDQLGVAEMKRVLKPQGSIIVTVPAFMNLWSEHDEVNHHFRRYNKKELKALFINRCGNIEYCSYFNFFLFLPIWLTRSISNFFSFNRKRQQLQSDFSRFNNIFLNNILYKVFLSEKTALQRKVTLPFGVSLILLYKNT